jgi:hypothetical protein
VNLRIVVVVVVVVVEWCHREWDFGTNLSLIFLIRCSGKSRVFGTMASNNTFSPDG